MGCKEFLYALFSLRKILIVVLTPIVLLPLPLVGNSPEAKCAYVVIIMAVFWISESIPIAVTSLLPIIMFPLVGLMSAKTVSSQYINDTAALFLGGLMVAAAIENWDIHKRIALGILTIVGAEPRWLMLGLMLPTWFLSMWISNTATTAMMIPITNAVLLQLKNVKKSTKDTRHGIDNQALDADAVHFSIKPGKEKDASVTLPISNGANKHQATNEKAQGNEIETESTEEENDPHYLRMAKGLSLSIAYSANVGGIGSLTGTAPNIVMKGFSDIMYEGKNSTSPVTFATWMQFGLPLSAIMVLIVWIWLQIFFLRCRGCCSCCDEDNEDKEDVRKRVKAVIRQEYKNLGKLNFAQGAVIFHFVLLAILWVTRDLGGVGGWGDIFPPKTVTDSTPSILISISLFIFPSVIPTWLWRKHEEKGKLKPLISWEVVEKKLPWGVILLLGGGFALAKASEVSGLSSWLGDKLTVFGSLDPWVMNLVLCYIVTFATEVTSNTAICTLMMPIMSQLALNLGVHPLYFMFPTAIATSFAFMLPVATPPNAVVFSYGYVKVVDMVSAGFLLNIVAVPVLILITETLGNSMFGFHTMPEIFIKNVNETIAQLSNETCWCTNSTVNSTVSLWIQNILQ